MVARVVLASNVTSDLEVLTMDVSGVKLGERVLNHEGACHYTVLEEKLESS